MTPWGLEQFHKAKTGYDGKALGNGVYPNEKDWNDPVLRCDPTGFRGITLASEDARNGVCPDFEELIQFFADGRTWRDIWTDGRKLPSDDADALVRMRTDAAIGRETRLS